MYASKDIFYRRCQTLSNFPHPKDTSHTREYVPGTEPGTSDIHHTTTRKI